MVIKFIFITTFAPRSLYTLSCCRDVSILDIAEKEIAILSSIYFSIPGQFYSRAMIASYLELSMARSQYQMAFSNQKCVHCKSRLQKK